MNRSAAFALSALLACGAPARPVAPPSSTSSLLGQPAPSFKRDTLAGQKLEVGGASGKVGVVKFVAKYCQPCLKTLPAIEKFHAEHPEVDIVAVSEDETEAEARELVASYHLTFPVVHDSQQVLAARWRVSALPVAFVLDGKGTVVWVGASEKTEEDLMHAIAATAP